MRGAKAMGERKTPKEVYRDGTLQSVRGAKAEDEKEPSKERKEKPSEDRQRSGSLQSIRGASSKKETSASKAKQVIREKK